MNSFSRTIIWLLLALVVIRSFRLEQALVRYAYLTDGAVALSGKETSYGSVGINGNGENIESTLIMKNLRANTSRTIHKADPVVPPPPSDDNICTVAQTHFRQASGLFAIVTGLEHSGTTLVSEFLMSAPHLYGAFECGILLAKTPSFFPRVKPFFQRLGGNVTQSLHWGLAGPQRQELLRAPCLAAMYRGLRQYSPLFTGDNAESWLVDKTPRYIYNLTKIMRRAPGVPIVITLKTDDEQFTSLRKRRVPGGKALKRMQKAAQSIRDAQTRFPQHPIVFVNMTKLKGNPDAVMEETFQQLGLVWDPAYKSLEAFNAKGQGIGRCLVPPYDESIVVGVKSKASKVVGKGCENNNW